MPEMMKQNITVGFEAAIELVKAETIRNLLPGVFHEINNHIAAVVGYSELLSCEAGLSETMLSDIQKLQDGAEQIQDIMELLSKLCFAEREKERNIFLFNNALKDTLRLMEKLIRNKNMKVDSTFSPTDQIFVVGNENSFKILLIAKLIALMKAAQRGSAIEITTEKSENNVFVSINYIGNGSIPEINSHVESFSSGVLSNETISEVCSTIIYGMGGKYYVENDSDENAFKIELARVITTGRKTYISDFSLGSESRKHEAWVKMYS